MRRTEEITHEEGIPRQALYYMENKGFISPRRKRVGRRILREYSDADVELAKLVWSYHDADGLLWDAAYTKATEELGIPSKL
jgi:DNA-binding transcriptional MerR regulator